VFAKARKLLSAVGLSLALLLATGAVAQATPHAQPAPSSEAGVLGGCDWTGCGTVINSTNRGFYVTLLWGGPWNDQNVKWVPPWSTYGGGGIDVDGILVATGCEMTGVINGRIPGYNYPFFWISGWHKIWTNETALVTSYVC
jgi:hypothetical protein